MCKVLINNVHVDNTRTNQVEKEGRLLSLYQLVPPAFHRYLYTDTAILTADNVTGLLYTSRKYAVDALQYICVTVLKESLTEDNVCQILEHCHDYGETDLEQKALKILTEAMVKVIKSPEFQELCSYCLEKFLKSENLNLKEEEVFEGVLSWAKATCNKEDISTSTENLIKVLGPMRYEVRYTEFSLKYLVNVVGPSGILTNDERVRIIDRFANFYVDVFPFKHNPRGKSQSATDQESRPHYAKRYLETGQGVLYCSGKPEAVSCTVSKNISLVGCRLYKPVYELDSDHMLSILLCDDQDRVIARPLQNHYLNLTCKGKLMDVFFAEALPVVVGQTYTICVIMSGNLPCFGYNGQSSVSVDGVTFTFVNSKLSTNTTITQGQIPELIWR